jgi:hypothetical protein
MRTARFINASYGRVLLVALSADLQFTAQFGVGYGNSS